MEKVNYGLDGLHEVQLKMLKKLISLCEEKGYSYFLAFGSLLGAVREHKIIAWDDSIDVVMPYQDYAQLTALPQEVWGGSLFLQTYYTDPEFPRCYARLRDGSTTLIQADYAAYDINHGIYITIMPLINLADQADERRKQMNEAQLFEALTAKEPVSGGKGALRLYSSILLAASDQQRVRKREETRARVLQYEGKDTRDCFALAGSISLNLPLPKAWFASAVEWDFENMKVNIPAGWHEWLTLRYGDYMVAPISDLQGDKISKFVTLNTQRPYTDYKGKAYCTERDGQK